MYINDYVANNTATNIQRVNQFSKKLLLLMHKGYGITQQALRYQLRSLM